MPRGDYLKMRIVKLPFVVLVLCALFLTGLFYYFHSTIRISDESFGIAKFIYGDMKIETEITDENLNQLVDVFEGKILKIDSPSCGFTENVSVKIDDKTFCIACDTCGVIYLLEDDKYFFLSDEENETIRKILKSYGFEFPCI